ncbi:MotA/TolQ/ExbB proton channel family protein [Pseudoduganella buxea]|uniref:Flagellar motor protein MotA n=1 Tax=Pseudoduganella buxea TaxID=1949069 RepID=A0A6I3SVL9_9BURK|nr:MotA/TolQ/ExbB proton channel family protein [Pseudoduganella buxea]MTV53114.1 MotA/TolQ/ExbB proton channel family protein [Pseudoduganella buxea]GGB85112.1 flagellar motor protein MotA [Pseudoduganella buxea]
MFDLPADGAVRTVESLLYSVSTLLYLPVLLGIAALALYMLVCLGVFAGEWRERRCGVRMLVDAARAQMLACAADGDGDDAAAAPLDARLERIVQRADGLGLRRLDRVRFVVRVGPALGLMGTLIPMGIALAGLAQGNVPKMAESMTTAFTATVVGLAGSVLAYVLALAREHWLRADMTDVAFCAEEILHARRGGLHLVRKDS